MDNTIFTTTMQLIATAFSCIHAASTIIRLVTTFDKPSRDIDAGDSWHARVVTIKKVPRLCVPGSVHAIWVVAAQPRITV